MHNVANDKVPNATALNSAFLSSDDVHILIQGVLLQFDEGLIFCDVHKTGNQDKDKECDKNWDSFNPAFLWVIDYSWDDRKNGKDRDYPKDLLV